MSVSDHPNRSVALRETIELLETLKEEARRESFSRQCFDYARHELGKHPQLELTASIAAPVIVGFVLGSLAGLTWSSLFFGFGAGLLSAVLTLVVTWIIIFSVYLKRAPTVLFQQKEAEVLDLRSQLSVEQKSSKDLSRTVGEFALVIGQEREQKDIARSEVSRLAEEIRSLKEARDARERHNLVFHLDANSSRARSANNGIELKLMLRFKNNDTNDWSMEDLDVTLHQRIGEETKDLTTFLSFRYALNGIEIQKQGFKPMLIQRGRVIGPYEVTVHMRVLEAGFNGLSSLSYYHFIRVTMDANNQPPFTQEYIFTSINSEQNHATLFNLQNPDTHWHRALRHLDEDY